MSLMAVYRLGHRQKPGDQLKDFDSKKGGRGGEGSGDSKKKLDSRYIFEG